MRAQAPKETAMTFSRALWIAQAAGLLAAFSQLISEGFEPLQALKILNLID
jgi:hypothetical protein